MLFTIEFGMGFWIFDIRYSIVDLRYSIPTNYDVSQIEIRIIGQL